jgi:hypothetical protein
VPDKAAHAHRFVVKVAYCRAPQLLPSARGTLEGWDA